MIRIQIFLLPTKPCILFVFCNFWSRESQVFYEFFYCDKLAVFLEMHLSTPNVQLPHHRSYIVYKDVGNQSIIELYVESQCCNLKGSSSSDSSPPSSFVKIIERTGRYALGQSEQTVVLLYLFYFTFKLLLHHFLKSFILSLIVHFLQHFSSGFNSFYTTSTTLQPSVGRWYDDNEFCIFRCIRKCFSMIIC